MGLVACENGVGHEAVKVAEGGVANRSGLKTTSTIGNIAPRVVLHHGTLITCDFRPKLLVIEILMGEGPNTCMKSLKQQSNGLILVWGGPIHLKRA